MKSLKRITLLFMVCFIVSHCLFVHKVYAVDAYKVSTDTKAVKKVSDTQYIIPLYLLGNDGIMGFRICLGSLNEEYKITSITSGLLTSKGNFNTDNSTDDEQYYTNVLWNNVENVTGDGSLMYIAIELNNKDVKQIDMEVSYSQEDTFDEEWKDVVLSCENVSISLEKANEENASDASDLSGLVNNKEEEVFLEQAETNIKASEKARKIESDKVKGAVIRTLKKYEITSISDIPEDKESIFWEDVESDLMQNERVRKRELQDVDVEDLANGISITDEDYYSDQYELVEVNTNKDEQQLRVIIIAVLGIAIVMLLSIVIIVCKGRGKKNEQ